MRAAIIHDGIVENIIIASDGFNPGEGRSIILLDDASPVAIGWRLEDGDLVPPTIPAPVPEAVTARQARLVLFSVGMLDAVESQIGALPGPQGVAARIEWEYALEIRRDSPLISSLAPRLGLTGQQVDALFVAAAGL